MIATLARIAAALERIADALERGAPPRGAVRPEPRSVARAADRLQRRASGG